MTEPTGALAPTNELVPLVERLAEPEARSRRRAVRALAALGPAAETAVPALIAAFCDRDLEVRRGAVRALAAVGAAAVPALLEAAQTDHPDVRKVAIVTLGEIGPEARAAVP